MKMVRGLGVGVLVSALVGCAAKPAPQLDAQGYNIFAGAWYEVNNCIESGSMAPEVGALGKRYVESHLGRFSFNPSLFESEYRRIAATGPVSREKCNQLAADIMRQRHQTEINNQNAARTEQQIRDAINSRPTNTYCNKIGTQVLCNSY